MSKQKHEELLVANDIATWTHLDPQTIRRMTRRGQIPGAVNAGTAERPAWRYDPQQVAAWMCTR
ncbi:helix-turn-helix domain-containing protein [Flexivirga sp.]|uniref:helix-turn-helix domain-containing protein n=1 Tax=Flexivirga sp. TaxID=1962927 RepID=UPI003F80932F